MSKEQKQIKPFDKVKVGDLAMENPAAGGEWNNEYGPIVWKGSFEEVKASEYAEELTEWLLNGGDEEYLSQGNYIVVKDPMYGNILFLYDDDPSSAVVFEY